MPSKSLLKRGFKSEAERIAERYRTELKISKYDPLDAFKLAEHLEIPVISVDEFKGDLHKDHYKTLCDPNKFSAMWMPNSDGDKIIIHNHNHSEKRQQSNLMHELAHIILKHEIPVEAAQLCFLLGLHYYNVQQEQEAKHLGGCLQLPLPGILWAMKHYTNDQMSDYYNASTDMVKYRINASGAASIAKRKTKIL